jgi:hypothetical protein
MNKLNKAIIGCIDTVEIVFKSEGVVVSRTEKRLGRFKKLKPGDYVTLIVPNVAEVDETYKLEEDK